MRVRVDVLGDVVLDRRLVRIGERAQNLEPAWREAMDYLEGWAARNFQAQGGLTRSGWAPLAESTVAAKGHDTILEDTRALRESMTGGGAGAVREVDPLGALFGTSVPYAAFHQFGTSRMPRRPLIELREPEARDVVKIIQRFVMEGTVPGAR